MLTINQKLLELLEPLELLDELLLDELLLDELRDELINGFTEYFMNNCAPGNPELQAQCREMYREYFFTYFRNEFKE